jgi:hypothetical protein
MPDVRCERDVRALAALPDDVDLLVGGFPCQDLSQAGLARGIGGARSGLVGEAIEQPVEMLTSPMPLQLRSKAASPDSSTEASIGCSMSSSIASSVPSLTRSWASCIASSQSAAS